MNTSAPICISNYVRNNGGPNAANNQGGLISGGAAATADGNQRPIQSRGTTRRQAQSNVQGNMMRRTGGINGANTGGVGMPYHQNGTVFH